MASIWKHPQSKFWYARFRNKEGKYTNQSTKQLSRDKAIRVAQAYEDVALGKYATQQIQKVILDLQATVTGDRIQSESTREYLSGWLELKRAERSHRTHEKYRKIVQEFLSLLGDKANQAISNVTVSDVSRFRDATLKRTSPATANNNLKIVRSALQRAWKAGLMHENPALKVDGLATRKADSKRRPFTEEELKALLGVAKGEWRGMIAIGLYTGIRLSDIAALAWNNVDYETNVIRFITSKTGHPLSIPIASPLQEALEELPHGDNPRQKLFPLAAQKRVSRLSHEFHEIMVAAGLAKERSHEKQGNGRNGKRQRNEVSFHSLRHNTVTFLKLAGVPQAVAGEIVGHKSEAMTRIYTHVDDDAKRLALANLPNFLSKSLSRIPSKPRHAKK